MPSTRKPWPLPFLPACPSGGCGGKCCAPRSWNVPSGKIDLGLRSTRHGALFDADTLIALADRDAPGRPYEIRLQGRVNTIAPGEDLELLGHITPHDAALLPRMAVSVKHDHWWLALRPLRPGDADFIVKETNNFRTMKRENSYAKEIEGVFSVNVPNPAKAAPVVPAAPASSAFGKLLGAAKQAAGAAAPAMIAADLRPVYLWVFPALVAFGTQQAAEKPAPIAYADDSDDLPPM